MSPAGKKMSQELMMRFLIIKRPKNHLTQMQSINKIKTVGQN